MQMKLLVFKTEHEQNELFPFDSEAVASVSQRDASKRRRFKLIFSCYLIVHKHERTEPRVKLEISLEFHFSGGVLCLWA